MVKVGLPLWKDVGKSVSQHIKSWVKLNTTFIFTILQPEHQRPKKLKRKNKPKTTKQTSYIPRMCEYMLGTAEKDVFE